MRFLLSTNLFACKKWQLISCCQNCGVIFVGKRFRRSESVVTSKDAKSLQNKFEKRFVRLMREKYGIGFGNLAIHKPKVKLEYGTGLKRMDPKKMQILSKLLFNSISEIMASGEIVDNFETLENLNISKVILSKDLRTLSVHWLAAGTDSDMMIQKVLDDSIDTLRKCISRLDYVGFVPKIEFCRDLSEAHLAEFTRLLEKADKGDFHPLTEIQKAYFRESEKELDLKNFPEHSDSITVDNKCTSLQQDKSITE